MSDDPWIDALGAVARDESDVDPRLIALARGELGPAAVEALRLEARTDPELARAMELFAPLAPEQVARAKAHVAAPPFAAPPIVLQARRRPVWMMRAAATAGAVAACVLAALLLWPRASLLPAYQLQLSGGDRELRSTAAPVNDVPQLSAGSRLEVILRPADAIAKDALFVAAFADSQAGVAPLAATPEISAQGSVRIAAEIERLLPGARGEVELIFVIGPKVEQSDAKIDALLRGGETPDGWQVLRRRVHIR